jgi:phage terminase small subunit
MPGTNDPCVVTQHEAEFAAEYLVDLNGTQALLRIRPGITKASAAVQASRLLRRHRVMQLIRKLQAERAKRAEIRADEVLVRLWEIATADPRELISIRIVPCNQCYPSANSRDIVQEPNPACSACFGDGRPKMVLADTRSLSPGAAALYAGVRPTRWGMQVLLNNQLKALDLIGQHLGMWGGCSSASRSGNESDPLQQLLDEIREQHAPQDPPEIVPSPAGRSWRAV